jgi:hypothetical protein
MHHGDIGTRRVDLEYENVIGFRPQGIRDRLGKGQLVLGSEASVRLDRALGKTHAIGSLWCDVYHMVRRPVKRRTLRWW